VSAPLALYTVNGPPTDRQELEQLRRVIRVLEEHFAGRQTVHYLVVQPFVQPFNLDALLITPRKFFVLEFKSIRDRFEITGGGLSYRYRDDGNREPWDQQNQYQRVRSYNFALLDHIRKHRDEFLSPAKLEAFDEYRQVHGMLVVQFRHPDSIVGVDVSYFSVSGESEIGFRIDEYSNAVELTEAELLAFLGTFTGVRELSREEAGLLAPAAAASGAALPIPVAAHLPPNQPTLIPSAASRPRAAMAGPPSSGPPSPPDAPHRPQASDQLPPAPPAAARLGMWPRVVWIGIVLFAAFAVLAGLLRPAVGDVRVVDSARPSASSIPGVVAATQAPTTPSPSPTIAAFGPTATVRPGVTLAVTDLQPAAPYTSNLRATFKITNASGAEFWPRFDPTEVTMTEDSGRRHTFQFAYWPPGQGPPGPMPTGASTTFDIEFAGGGLSPSTSRVDIRFGSVSGVTGLIVSWPIT